jgi:hypothetical protein
MKSLISFGVYVAAFILTGYFVSVGNWTSAALFFMIYLNSLAADIIEAIEKKLRILSKPLKRRNHDSININIPSISDRCILNNKKNI